ncbi:MAG TPA: hypothetical protein VMF09_03805 [Solirubrobacteraceae bacterium]|nr:hypothetical protein [Solirubrobacteraceae bacterium]
MYQPTLLRDRPRPEQILLGGFIPAIAGAIAGVLIGVSVGAYWGYAAVVAIASVLAGFEHQDGWGGADRGLIAGAIYGAALLIVHALVGTHAKVSLGSFPPFLAVITAIAGMLLSATGGRLARAQRERAQARETPVLTSAGLAGEVAGVQVESAGAQVDGARVE